MVRKGYYHGDEFIEYKRGNLTGQYGFSSKNNHAKKLFIILELTITLINLVL